MHEILRPSPWSRRAPDMPPVLDERAWRERRALLKTLGLGGLVAGLSACGFGQDGSSPIVAEGYTPDAYPPSDRWVPAWEPAGGAGRYPAPRNTAFTGGRPITAEDAAARQNNFYEFYPGKAGPVYRHVDAFRARPWTIEIGGLVEAPRTVDLDELTACAPLEERIYRFRCVEAWSMVVPWTGVPMAAFVKWCKPEPEARYLKFTSFLDPEMAPGQRKAKHYPWPYYEGLRMDEALHPLSMIVTGIYGHGLPAQHGAPIRAVVPWKYGYKSPKSFVKVEFTAEQPGTFWSDLQPDEYPFLSNVDPRVPHPRWSQATERDLATGDRMPTRSFNGYDAVAGLYG